jgi:ABC-type amino acid transport substrate-binding protein
VIFALTDSKKKSIFKVIGLGAIFFYRNIGAGFSAEFSIFQEVFMRLCAFALVLFIASYSYGRSPASIRKDAFTVGVSRADSVAEYDFIAEISAKMKFSKFRLVVFDNANAGQKLLLDDKIDAIIAKISYSPHLESKFLVSDPYGKAEIAVAVLSKNSEIWTLADINGKKLAFIPKDVSSEQIQNIWPNSKPVVAQNLATAIGLLQKQEAIAIIASKESLESDSTLKTFPNKLLETNIVALFAPKSKALQEEFNKALNSKNSVNSANSGHSGSDKRIDRIITLIDELKKELDLLKKELK